MDRLWERFWREEAGTTSIEYALIAALIFLAIVGSVVAVFETLEKNYYTLIEDGFNEAVNQ